VWVCVYVEEDSGEEAAGGLVFGEWQLGREGRQSGGGDEGGRGEGGAVESRDWQQLPGSGTSRARRSG